MDYLKTPVTLDCGHNFCKDCISQYCETWEDLGENLECALCKAKIKRGNFQQNWQLANIIEKIQLLNMRKEVLCVRHKEKLNLFCKEDKELVCVFCERSQEHQSHNILLLEDAAKECKEQLCSHLQVLRMEWKRILVNKAGTEEESQDLLSQIEDKKTRTVAAFNKLQQILENKKLVLLSQLEELKEIITTRREQHMTRLKKELTSLKGLIQQMEEKCQQPTSELLQDIRRTLERCEKKEAFQNPVAFPPELTCTIRGTYNVKPLLDGVIKEFSEQHFIVRHREQLIQRTTDVEGVLDILYGITLNKEQYQRIRAKATRPEKMRELYSLMPGWNNIHKDLLYRAIKSKNRLLIEDLEFEATE